MADPAPAAPARDTRPAASFLSMLSSGRFSDTKLVFKLVEATAGQGHPDASSGPASAAQVVPEGACEPGAGISSTGAADHPQQPTSAPSSALAQAGLSSSSSTHSFDTHAIILAQFSEYFSRRLDEEAAGWRVDGQPSAKRRRVGADGALGSTSRLPDDSALAASASEATQPAQTAVSVPEEARTTGAASSPTPTPTSVTVSTPAPAPTLPQSQEAPAKAASEAEADWTLAPGQRLLIERLEDPSDLPAAEQLVRFIYHQVLPEEVTQDPGLLCKVAQLADRYQVPTCITAATQALGQIKPEQLEVQHIDQVLHLSDSLLEHSGCQALLEACGKRIEQLFGNVLQVIRMSSEKEKFPQLPFKVVKLWAEADGLTVSSENDVVVLLTLWCNSNRDSVTYEQRQQLSELVRLRHLTNSYLISILPQLDWFVADAKELRKITTLAATSSESHDAWEWLAPWLKDNTKIPPGWLAEARDGTPNDDTRKFSLKFGFSDAALASAISTAQDGGTSRLSEPVSTYMAGYDFELIVEFRPCNIDSIDIDNEAAAAAAKEFSVMCSLTVCPTVLGEATADNTDDQGWAMSLDVRIGVDTSHEEGLVYEFAAALLSDGPSYSVCVLSDLKSSADLRQHMDDDMLEVSCIIGEVY